MRRSHGMVGQVMMSVAFTCICGKLMVSASSADEQSVQIVDASHDWGNLVCLGSSGEVARSRAFLGQVPDGMKLRRRFLVRAVPAGQAYLLNPGGMGTPSLLRQISIDGRDVWKTHLSNISFACGAVLCVTPENIVLVGGIKTRKEDGGDGEAQSVPASKLRVIASHANGESCWISDCEELDIGTVAGICLGADDSIYIVGTIASASATSSNESWIARLSSKGVVMWTRTWGDVEAWSVCRTGDAILVCGTTIDHTHESTLHTITAFDAKGTVLWRKDWAPGGGCEGALSVATNTRREIFVLGWGTGASSNLTSGVLESCLTVTKLTARGENVWCEVCPSRPGMLDKDVVHIGVCPDGDLSVVSLSIAADGMDDVLSYERRDSMGAPILRRTWNVMSEAAVGAYMAVDGTPWVAYCPTNMVQGFSDGEK